MKPVLHGLRRLFEIRFGRIGSELSRQVGRLILFMASTKRTIWRFRSPARSGPELNFRATKLKKNTMETYSVTMASNTAIPEPLDVQRSEELKGVLKLFDVIEADEDLFRRMEVLHKINEMFKQWIVETSLARNIPRKIAEQLGGEIYTFGSYRLGVHQRGADIDTLCVAPRTINRTDYFSSFYNKLKNCPEVAELRAVEEAFVPLMKFNFDGIEIDLLFATLNLSKIPDEMNLNVDMILKNLDERCARSLNGCRATDEILKLVPNVETFRLALHAIKLWAKQRGIYSNVLGYLGGVSWAILVAGICQLFPNAVAGTIVHRFFLIFAHWKWPVPVMLKPVTRRSYSHLPVWNPRLYAADRKHLMPIITPAYPEQNSAFNVSHSTRTILVRELKSAFRVTDKIMAGRSEWRMLFEKPDFFAKYDHFVLVIVTSATKERLEWRGMVEAKLKRMVTILECNRFVRLVHPNPEIFKLKRDYFRNENRSESEEKECWVTGVDFHELTNKSIIFDLSEEIENFVDGVMKYATCSKMYKQTMKIEGKHVRRKNLPKFISVVGTTENPLKRKCDASDSNSDSTEKRPSVSQA